MCGRPMQTACWQRRHSIPARVKGVHREGISEGRAIPVNGVSLTMPVVTWDAKYDGGSVNTIQYNTIHAFTKKSEIRVFFVVESLKDETPLVFSILGSRTWAPSSTCCGAPPCSPASRATTCPARARATSRRCRRPVLRLFPPCALISHAQGSSGVVENMPFAWRGHTESLTTRARPSPDLAVWLE